MSISSNDAFRLEQAGFTQYEIRELANATTPDGLDQPPIDLDSPVWQAVLSSRMEWIKDKVNRGWEEYEIQEELMAYYTRDMKRTPWDFLKAEYRPPKRVDYWAAMRNRKSAIIKNELGEY